MLNCSSSNSSKENMPPTGKSDSLQVQKGSERTVLGVLSDNEVRDPSESQDSQFSELCSDTGSSPIIFYVHSPSSSEEVHVEDTCEVILSPSGDEVDRQSMDEEESPEIRDLRHLLELSAEQNSSSTSQPEESDSEDVSRPNHFAEDTYWHMRQKENKFQPKSNYFENHPQLNGDMRLVLVDWLAEVTYEFQLSPETLHLAINYLDRFLSRTRIVKRSRLQLIGTAALLIAAKYEDVFPPKMHDCVYVTDNSYSTRDLVRMERAMLRILGFTLSAPTVHRFLHLYVTVVPVCTTTQYLAQYISELSLMEVDFYVKHSPSLVAVGSYVIANYAINSLLWPDELESFTNYSIEAIANCVADLYQVYVYAQSRPQQIIRKKYSTARYHSVATIPPPVFSAHFWFAFF
ncbi:cyclin-A1-like [Synchiropus splendidus]|uniref:cyclin-A1-like n=1 Tax=Synchiropus splendidus TaxID=270530 RepID=UPI00237D9C40|nr:cyclin-A1-like [Synchiropus splendidus]XP_053704149.1 cyclin-A1-like [Synchiropus splendidus]